MEALTFDVNSGFKAASYREIREALQEDFKRVFGEGINLDPSTPDGQLLDIFAYAYNALAQNIQGIVTNLNPATASGVFLDYLANLAVGGRNPGETDQELAKRVQSADRYGYATYTGMLTYLKKYLGVNTGLQANEEDKVVDGVNPNSFIVSVPAECELDNDAIAQHIFTCKPAGIRSQGTESGFVYYEGQKFVVRFSRVHTVNVYFEIAISEYTEEALPANYQDAIKDAVAAWAETEYTAGKDVILQRVVIPVFSVPGVLNVAVKARTEASAAWTEEGRISIGGANRAVVSRDNIGVSLA